MPNAIEPGKGRPGLRGREQPAPDGPARVVKPGDWGAVAEPGLKGFAMASFSVPGRVQPKPDPAEARLAELQRKLVQAESAHKEALRKAAAEAEEKARAAHAKGREEGRAEGEAAAAAKYDRNLQDLRKGIRGVLEALSREKAALFLGFEGEAVALAGSAIRRVFEGVAESHAEAVLPLLRKAVAALGDASGITVRINPADFEVIEGGRSFWLPLESALKDIRIAHDARIPKGGCLVESDSTSVEMRAADLAERIGEELARVFDAKSSALRAQGSAPGAEASIEGATPDAAEGGTAATDGPGGMVDEDEPEGDGTQGASGGPRT
jgi:flagellar biosynthesis/type III secretory pathway protein FliH